MVGWCRRGMRRRGWAGDPSRPSPDAGGGARHGGCGPRGRARREDAGCGVWCLGDREFVVGGVRGRERERVRRRDVCVLLGDGGRGPSKFINPHAKLKCKSYNKYGE